MKSNSQMRILLLKTKAYNESDIYNMAPDRCLRKNNKEGPIRM